MSKISTFSKLAVKAVSDNSPTVLTGIGVTGTFATAVLAAKGAYKAAQKLESEDPYDSVRDKALETWKFYIPAAAVGTATVACILGANSISTRRNAALISVYSLTDTAFKEYKDKVAETIGAGKEEKIRDEVAKDQIERNPVSSQVIITGEGDVLCYDSITGRYFHSGAEKLKAAQNEINARTINEMYASQNDFYRLVGLPMTGFGEEVGWRTDNMLDLEFSSMLAEDGRPCLSIHYRTSPIRGYYKMG